MSETSTEVAVRMTPAQAELETVKEKVRLIANTDFVPGAMRGNHHAILACILYGQEMGIGPMESLAEVHLVDGRPAPSAKLMLKKAREKGHIVHGDANNDRATVTGRRGDDGSEMTITVTFDEMSKVVRKGKKLVDGDNWTNYRSDMLWARAVGRLCRRLFTDVFGALPYASDEVESVAYAHATTDADRETIAATDDLPLVEDNPIEGEVVNSVETEISEQEQLGSEFVRMAQDAQAKKGEPGS